MPVHPGEQTQPLCSLLHLPPFRQSSQLKLQSLPKVLSRQTEMKKIYRRFSEHPDKIIPQALNCRSRCTSAKRNLHNIDSQRKVFTLFVLMLVVLQIPLIHHKRQSQMEIPKFSSSNFRVQIKGKLGL